jgi:hypothetical protein
LKDLVKVVQAKDKFSEYALKNNIFDLDDGNICKAFEEKDFEFLMQNQNLDRQKLFICCRQRIT